MNCIYTRCIYLLDDGGCSHPDPSRRKRPCNAAPIKAEFSYKGTLEGNKWQDFTSETPGIPSFTVYYNTDVDQTKVQVESEEWVNMWITSPLTNESVCKAISVFLSKLSRVVTVEVTIKEKGECLSIGK